jgi:caffeoyl-CoA O-methyltransferase
MLRAKNAIELGTFTGYSALCVARALPADGRLIACDVSEDWTSIAKRYWEEAGVADKIDLRIGPALETLDAMVESGQTGSFDFAFVDADKDNYAGYYERCLALLRPGGLVGVDNTLWNGAVADPDDQSDETVAIRALNRLVYEDDRVDSCLLPIGDGLTLACKR